METTVREARKKMGIKQQDLAKMAGVTRQTISAIEKGKYSPSLLLAYKLSVLLESPKIEEIFLLGNEEIFKEGELEELKAKYMKNQKYQKNQIENNNQKNPNNISM